MTDILAELARSEGLRTGDDHDPLARMTSWNFETVSLWKRHWEELLRRTSWVPWAALVACSSTGAPPEAPECPATASTVAPETAPRPVAASGTGSTSDASHELEPAKRAPAKNAPEGLEESCFEGLEPCGLMTARSRYDVPTTVKRLESAAQSRGLSVMAKVDHEEGAVKSGQNLDPTVLLLIGNPETGTPLMQAEPTLGIALPLHVLVWTQAGRTAISFDAPSYLARRFQLDTPTFEKMEQLLLDIVAEAGGP